MTRSLAWLPLVTVALLGASVAAAADDPAPPPAPAKAEPGAFEPGAPSWADLQTKSKSSERPVLIDFSTAWCGWCKKLDAEVFPRAEVVESLKKFVCAHLDAEVGEGETLAKKYGVRGFPTLLVLDAEGAEIDRIVGYRNPKAFVEEVGRIARGEGTLPALRKAVADHPEDVAAAVARAKRELVTDRAAGMKRLGDALERAGDKDRTGAAEALLALGAAEADARDSAHAEEHFRRLLGELGDTPAAARSAASLQTLVFLLPASKAFGLLDLARQAAKEPKDVLAAAQLAHVWHQAQAAKALKEWAGAVGDDAQALNEVAWTAFLQKMAPKDALAWARKAVDLSERDPAVLDTLANLLQFVGKLDEAVTLEEEALAKSKEPRMRAEFAVNIAMWKAAQQAKRAQPAEASEDDSDK